MAEHDDAGITPEVWRQIVDLGWTGLLVPEEPAVSGSASSKRSWCRRRWAAACSRNFLLVGDPRDARRGAALGLDDQLAALASGTQRGTVALDEAGYGDPIERVHVRANGRGTRYKLDGVKPMVPDGLTADWVISPPATCEGLQSFLVEDPQGAKLLPNLDVTRKFARLEFSETAHARRAARRPRRDLAPRSRRRGRAHRRRADRRERGRQPDRVDYAQTGRCSASRSRSSRSHATRRSTCCARIELARGSACTTRPGPPTWRSIPWVSWPRAGQGLFRGRGNYVPAECIQIHGGVGYTRQVPCAPVPAAGQGRRPDASATRAGSLQRVADLYFASGSYRSRGANHVGALQLELVTTTSAGQCRRNRCSVGRECVAGDAVGPPS